MDVELEFKGLDIAFSGPGGPDIIVRFMVRSDFGEMIIPARERRQEDETLDDTVNRAREKIRQFAEALQKTASAPMFPAKKP